MTNNPHDKLMGSYSFFSKFILIIFVLAVTGFALERLGFIGPSNSPPLSSPSTASKKMDKPQPQKEEAHPAPNYPSTPADRLKEAKRQLTMKSEQYPYGDIYYAFNILQPITKDAPEYPEAQALLKKNAKWKETDLAAIRKKTAAEKRTNRLLYAAIIENKFLDKGYDISVKVLGKNDTTLQLKYVLVSRVFVHHLSKDTSLIQEWRELGFKRIVFTDGFRSKWVMDL